MDGRLAVLAALVLIVPAVPAPSASAATGQTVGWWSDPAFSGDLVYRVTVDPGSFTRCDIVFRFTGATNEDRPLRWWLSSAEAGFSASSREPQPDRIDLLDVTYERGDTPHTAFFWSVNITVDARFSDAVTFTAAGLDLRSVGHTMPGGGHHRHPAAGFNATCSSSVEATPLSASNDVLAFTEEDEHVVADLGGPETSASARAGLEASFDTDQAILWFHTFTNDGASATLAELDHPDGDKRWRSTTVTQHRGGDQGRFVGPGGDYRFQVTRAGYAADHGIRGILAGLDPVASFDEIA